METNSQSTTAESTQPIDWIQTLIDGHHEMMQEVIEEARRRNAAGNTQGVEECRAFVERQCREVEAFVRNRIAFIQNQ